VLINVVVDLLGGGVMVCAAARIRRIAGVLLVVLLAACGAPARPSEESARSATTLHTQAVAWLSDAPPDGSVTARPTAPVEPSTSAGAWVVAAQGQAGPSGGVTSSPDDETAPPSGTDASSVDPAGPEGTAASTDASASATGGVRAVAASAETVVMPGASGDVADDMAIWRNPEHPEQSLIIGDNKADSGGGLAVYRLDGSLVHYERTGKIGNVDLRLAGVGDSAVVLVGANDRQSNTVRFWSLDPGSGTLTSLDARALPTGAANYGFCLGRDPSAAHTYAFVTARDSGLLEQYELWAHDGKIDAIKMRSFDVGSISEACAVDDTTGSLYVAEERAGLWRYDVDPATGSKRTQIDRTGGGHLTPDVEGVTVVRGADGHGYLLVSSQGDSTFATYDADGEHAYRGGFTVTGGGEVDGASVTDGLDAVPGDFGPNFPHGLLVVHDEQNLSPSGGNEPASNLKLVRLDAAVPLSG
jgi:3-phytase